MVEVDRRLPASEVPLWNAWQHIEPWGWAAQDRQTARLARMLFSMLRPGVEVPDFSDFITKDPDWRAFDPELQEEIETEQLIRNMKSVIRGEPSG